METPAITDMLQRWRAGEANAADALMRAVYPMLREIAEMRLRRHARGATLQPTELANEAYARLHHARGSGWSDRAHFFAFSARVIRNLTVDYLRARDAEKRGGDCVMLALDEIDEPLPVGDVDVIAIDGALTEREDAGVARVVELKFFAGMSTDEIAEACNVSRATVVRRWRYARAWLAVRLNATS